MAEGRAARHVARGRAHPGGPPRWPSSCRARAPAWPGRAGPVRARARVQRHPRSSGRSAGPPDGTAPVGPGGPGRPGTPSPGPRSPSPPATPWRWAWPAGGRRPGWRPTWSSATAWAPTPPPPWPACPATSTGPDWWPPGAGSWGPCRRAGPWPPCSPPRPGGQGLTPEIAVAAIDTARPRSCSRGRPGRSRPVLGWLGAEVCASPGPGGRPGLPLRPGGGGARDLAAALAPTPFSVPRLGFVSDSSGGPAGPATASPGYWVGHARAPVRFAAALAALGGRVHTLVELGPPRAPWVPGPDGAGRGRPLPPLAAPGHGPPPPAPPLGRRGLGRGHPLRWAALAPSPLGAGSTCPPTPSNAGATGCPNPPGPAPRP